MKQTASIAVALALVIAAVWCVFEILVLVDINDNMVGFHPLVFLAIPVGAALTLICLAIAFVRKSFGIGLVSLVPVIALALPIFLSFQLGMASWSKAIHDNSVANQTAIQGTDFSSAEFMEIPYKDHKRMVAVDGFLWPNAEELSAAKDGVFFGFTVNGVPHVYIAPLRNGCRGVAWITDQSIIGENPNVRYEYSGTTSWYIWTFSA